MHPLDLHCLTHSCPTPRFSDRPNFLRGAFLLALLLGGAHHRASAAGRSACAHGAATADARIAGVASGGRLPAPALLHLSVRLPECLGQAITVTLRLAGANHDLAVLALGAWVFAIDDHGHDATAVRGCAARALGRPFGLAERGAGPERPPH